jgi:hypothetical protein
MDQASVEQHAEDHAQAVVQGDMDAVIADFIPEMRAGVPELAKALPQPVNTAEVLSVEMADDDGAIVHVRYSGDESSLTIRTRWEDRQGRPLIVEGAPTG